MTILSNDFSYVSGAFQMGSSSLTSLYGAAAASTFGQPTTGFRPGGGFGLTTVLLVQAADRSVQPSMFSQQLAQSAFGQQPSTGLTFMQPPVMCSIQLHLCSRSGLERLLAQVNRSAHPRP